MLKCFFLYFPHTYAQRWCRGTGKIGHINDQIYSFFHFTIELDGIVSIDIVFIALTTLSPRDKLKIEN